MSESVDYDNDFVGWTERQAQILKSLPAGTFGLDIENLAEEIETLGRNEIREASSFIALTLVHLVKLAAEPDSLAAKGWFDEVLTFQRNATFAATSGIRQRINLPATWRKARNDAARSVKEHGKTLPSLPRECPLSLDELLAEDFDPRAAAAIVARSIEVAARDH